MARARKITQNINKDEGLLDLPKVKVPHSKWQCKHSNYVTCNIGEIYPIYVSEVLPDEERSVSMGQLSHMTTPIAPIMNAQYTEFRAFFVPHRLSADLLAGYKTRKSPWVKVFGEDNASSSANIIVPLDQQKLPDISSNLNSDFYSKVQASAFGGLADSLGYDEPTTELGLSDYNLLDMAAYELIYQKAYRNQNRESATNSGLYKFLFDIYNRTSSVTIQYDDSFHIANREKDYFTGSAPFTQKGDAINVNLNEDFVKVGVLDSEEYGVSAGSSVVLDTSNSTTQTGFVPVDGTVEVSGGVSGMNLVADLRNLQGISVEQLRLLIKTQEMLEKDMMYGSDYASSLNAHFGTSPMSLVLEEPLELKKVTITSNMQPIFQTSSTASESTILGTIGANATTQSGEFEIVPKTKFREYGYLIICAVHKAQNSYDATIYKPKRIFKKSRFDFYTPELNDLGFQPVSRKEFDPSNYSESINEAVSFNECWAEYRFEFNKVHGMFEPNRANALDYWTLAIASYSDVQSLYKQGKRELDRAVSIKSNVDPQFFDAYGFVETCSKPMSLHSIPGMDGVI